MVRSTEQRGTRRSSGGSSCVRQGAVSAQQVLRYQSPRAIHIPTSCGIVHAKVGLREPEREREREREREPPVGLLQCAALCLCLFLCPCLVQHRLQCAACLLCGATTAPPARVFCPSVRLSTCSSACLSVFRAVCCAACVLCGLSAVRLACCVAHEIAWCLSAPSFCLFVCLSVCLFAVWLACCATCVLCGSRNCVVFVSRSLGRHTGTPARWHAQRQNLIECCTFSI